jgi:hypothetical protein
VWRAERNSDATMGMVYDSIAAHWVRFFFLLYFWWKSKTNGIRYMFLSHYKAYSKPEGAHVTKQNFFPKLN